MVKIAASAIERTNLPNTRRANRVYGLRSGEQSMSIRPRLRSGTKYRTLLFEQHPQMLSQLIAVVEDPPVVCLDGISGQVVEIHWSSSGSVR